MTFHGDLADVAGICGEDVARALMETLPGLTLYIPEEIAPDNILSRLDPEIGARLCEHFAHDRINVPSRRAKAADTLARIEELTAEEKSTKEIALELGCTEAWVHTLRRRAKLPKLRKADPRQLSWLDED